MTKTDDGEIQRYEYDSALQCLVAGSTSLEYDGNGNTVKVLSPEGAYVFDYDSENRLTCIRTPSGEEVQYTYDAFGRLIARQDDGGTTHFTCAGSVLLFAGTADLSRGAFYTYGNGYYLSSRDTGSHAGGLCYHYDRLGNVSSISNAEGREVTAYEYNAFGEQLGDGSRHIHADQPICLLSANACLIKCFC